MCSTRSTLYLSSLCIGLTALILAGCGGGGSSPSTSRVTIVLSSSGGVTSRTPIPDSDIESLILTVTKIEFQRCDGDGVDDGLWRVDVKPTTFDPTDVFIRPGGTVQWVWTEDGEHTVTGGVLPDPDVVDPFEGTGSMKGDFVEFSFFGMHGDTFHYFSDNETDIAAVMAGTVVLDDAAIDDGDSGGGGHITVFTGSMPFDVVDTGDPSSLSEILNLVTLPSGRYCKIRLYVENPQLTLIPESLFDENAEIKLTANGRLFIGAHFELAPGGESILNIRFESLHLVESGSSGQLVLTPQMRADVVGSTAINQMVTFVSVDCASSTLIVQVEGGPELMVLLDAETLIKDFDEMLLDCTDLEGLTVGAPLLITGILSLGDMVDADTVVVILL